MEDQEEPPFPDQITLFAVPPVEGQHWPLNSHYIEYVWASSIGPTSTMLARRIGDLLMTSPSPLTVSTVELGDGIGVAPRRAVAGLSRLHSWHLIHFDRPTGRILTSGMVHSMSPGVLLGRSDIVRYAHDQLVATNSGAQTGHDRPTGLETASDGLVAPAGPSLSPGTEIVPSASRPALRPAVRRAGLEHGLAAGRGR